MNISTTETKNYLHKLIAETDDEGILSKVWTNHSKLKTQHSKLNTQNLKPLT